MTPVQVALPVKKVVMAAAGDQTSAVVANSESCAGEVYTWGSNMFGTNMCLVCWVFLPCVGNLGHGESGDITSPKRVDSLASHYMVRTIACGGHHTAVIADIVSSSVERSGGDDEVARSRFRLIRSCLKS